MMFAFNLYRKARQSKRMTPIKDASPVVLVPGYRDNSVVFRRLNQFLSETGFETHPLTLHPSDGRVPLNELAQQVDSYIENNFDKSCKVNFVGFSMGGIVVRYYLQRLGGLPRAERLITLGSPHRGTWMAYYSDRPGVRQMRPNSSFLQDLAQDEDQLDQIPFTSIWTPLDLTIVPSSSSVTNAGQHKRLLLPYHRALVTDQRSLHSIARALVEPVATRLEC